jgi:hypothetical protein
MGMDHYKKVLENQMKSSNELFLQIKALEIGNEGTVNNLLREIREQAIFLKNKFQS